MYFVSFVLVLMYFCFAALFFSPSNKTDPSAEVRPFSPRNYSAFDSEFSTSMVLLDSHSHTESMSVESLIEWHIAYGYTAFALTDHNQIGGVRLQEARELIKTQYNNSIVVIPGVEWTTCRFHMNFLGIDKEPASWANSSDRFMDDVAVKQIIKEVHEMGGVVSFNHRKWSEGAGMEVWPVKQLHEFGVDFVEVVNPEGLDLQALLDTRRYPQWNVGSLAGTDVHLASDVVNGWTVVNASEFSEKGVMDALRARSNSFIFIQVGVPQMAQTMESSDWQFLQPFYHLSRLLSSAYTSDRSGCDPPVVTIHPIVILGIVFWVGLFAVSCEILTFVLRRYFWNRTPPKKRESSPI